MTFKEEYTRDNEKLHINPQIKDRIILEVKREEKRAKLRQKIVRYGSFAACFVLIGSTLIFRNVGRSNKTEVYGATAVMAETAYEDITYTAGSGTITYEENGIKMKETLSAQEAYDEMRNASSVIKNEKGESLEAALAEEPAENKSIVRKEILLLIPLFLLITVMIAWAIFRKK